MSIINELRRRSVFRVGAAYAVVGWLLLQASDILLGGFGAPDWVFRSFAVLLILGWPLALFLAWAYELTPEGIKKASDVPLVESGTSHTGRKLDFIIIGVLVVSLGWFAWDKFTRETTSPPVDTAVQRAASIAVLPFVNMSPDPEQEYFSDGLSEEILILLAQIRELRVIGRTSSFAFKGRSVDLREIGTILNVSHLLEGSVRRAGDQLRITAQLIEVEGGTHLWARTFDRRLENVFEIQSEIAGAIAEALRVSLIGEAQVAPVVQVSASVEAYERFLQARRLIQGRTPDGMRAAGGLLDEALALDPDYAPAMASAALVKLLLADARGFYGVMPLTEAVARARPLLDRALSLDPRLADGHAVLGVLYQMTGRLDEAGVSLARALEIHPSHSDAMNWHATGLLTAGRLRESLAVRRQQAQIDPLNLANLSNLATSLLFADESEEAVALALRIETAFPEHPLGYRRHAEALVDQGRLAESLHLLQRASELGPGAVAVASPLASVLFALGDFEAVLRDGHPNFAGLALLALGRRDEALAAAEARVASAPGDRDAVLNFLSTLALAGEAERMLEVYSERWGTLETYEAEFRYNFLTTEMAHLAVAFRDTGRSAELEVLLERWNQRLAHLRANGYAYFRLDFQEAGLRTLEGDSEGALALVAVAIDKGLRSPALAREPVFAGLRGDPRFQAQVARMTGLINAEREKLGWAPMP